MHQKRTNNEKGQKGHYSEKRMSEVAATPRKLVIFSERRWFSNAATFYRRPTDMEHLAVINEARNQRKCDQPFFVDYSGVSSHQKMGLDTPQVKGHADGTLENVTPSTT